jgi:hypothetical protein
MGLVQRLRARGRGTDNRRRPDASDPSAEAGWRSAAAPASWNATASSCASGWGRAVPATWNGTASSSGSGWRRATAATRRGATFTASRSAAIAAVLTSRPTRTPGVTPTIGID